MDQIVDPLIPITETAALADICAQLAGDRFVTVDTEFMRETTYWPKLCLIQMAGPSGEALVDPLADGLDLAPFYALMADTGVIKVFHAARQDIEIIYTAAGVIPQPLFDSQIAAMVCGFGDAIGYEPLIKSLLGHGIDKTSRFTDWSRRPLNAKQLAYALADVTHLREAFPILEKKLEKSGRSHWVREEMAILENPETYTTDPEHAWKRLKFNAGNKAARAVFMEIAAWREREAQMRDVPRNRVLKDDGLREIALQRPLDPQALERLRAVPNGFSKSSRAKGIFAAVKAGLDKPDAEIFKQADQSRKRPETAAVTEMLKVLLKLVSAEHDVAPKLIASVADLEAIAEDDEADVPALKGWRRELFGSQALELKAGRIALTLERGKPALVEFE